MVQYNTPNVAAFVQVVVTNACGAGIGRKDVASVGNISTCKDADMDTLSPSSDQTENAIAGIGFTLGPVSVSFGGAETVYQWYRNTSKSTSGAVPVLAATSNTLAATEATAGTYYYYCVMESQCDNNKEAQSPFYEVKVTAIPAAVGTGSFTGKTCFDIAYSANGDGCGTLSARQPHKTDFSLTTEQDQQAGTSVATYTGTQVYTFTPSENVSNVRFVYNDPTGEAIESMTAKGVYSGTISAGQLCKAVVVYKPTLNTFLQGKTRGEVTAELYVIYNDLPGGLGTERSIKLVVNLQDCACCGAATTTGGWLNFMCHNLGADESLDPLSYVVGNADGSGGTLGWLFQSGRPADGHQKRNSTVSNQMNSLQVPGTDVFYIYIDGSNYYWCTSTMSENVWGNDTKPGTNNPCPTGWRLPTTKEWRSIMGNPTDYIAPTAARTNNRWEWTGKGYLVSESLFLPAAGSRSWMTGNLGGSGSSGYYHSSSVWKGTAYTMRFNNLYIDGGFNYGGSTGLYSYGSGGQAIRCVQQ